MTNKGTSLRSLFRFDLLTLVLLVACAAVVFARMEAQREQGRLNEDLAEYQELEEQLDVLLERMDKD